MTQVTTTEADLSPRAHRAYSQMQHEVERHQDVQTAIKHVQALAIMSRAQMEDFIEAHIGSLVCLREADCPRLDEMKAIALKSLRQAVTKLEGV